MIKLQALKPLSGDYGTVREGQEFMAADRVAEDLESRGLACRVHVGVVERIAKAFIGAPENKDRPVIVYAPRVTSSPPRITDSKQRRHR